MKTLQIAPNGLGTGRPACLTDDSDGTTASRHRALCTAGLILGFMPRNKPSRSSVACTFVLYTHLQLAQGSPGQLISAPVVQLAPQRLGWSHRRPSSPQLAFVFLLAGTCPGSGQTPTQPWIPSQHVSGSQERQGSWAPFLTKLGA